jgi:hypothetical protein
LLRKVAVHEILVAAVGTPVVEVLVEAAVVVE